MDLRTTDRSIVTVHDGDFIEAFDCNYLINASEYRCRWDLQTSDESPWTWEVRATNSSEIPTDIELSI
jgi:hypothetical protein